jgi:hypothetical protein
MSGGLETVRKASMDPNQSLTTVSSNIDSLLSRRLVKLPFSLQSSSS